MFTLDNFEDEIDDIYLQRGLQYFQNGKVTKIKNSGNGRWNASVAGNFDYAVEVLLADREIVDSVCNCPFDGDFCKHQIAVFFALAGDTPKVEKLDDAFLADMSKEELMALINSARSEIAEFDEFIATEIRVANIKNDKKSFKVIIRDSLNMTKDRHGFIGYWDGSRAVRGAGRVFDLAERLEGTNQIAAIDAYGAIIEMLVPALQCADDSNGDYSEYIELSFENLKSMAMKNLSFKAQKYLLDYCLAEYKKEKYNGWHFALGFLEIAGMAVGKSGKQRLFTALDKFVSSVNKEYSSDHETGKTALIKLSFLKKYETSQDVEQFITGNISLNDIREIAVKRSIAKNDLENAKKLAEEGVRINQQKLLGLEIYYLEMLLKIACEERNVPEQQRLLTRLFEGGRHQRFEYYEKLKKITAQNDWPDTVEKLAAKTDNMYDLAKIYEIEKQWDKVMGIVEKSDSHYMADQYYKQLSKLYPADLAKVYEGLFFEGIDHAGGRGDYVQRVIFLQKITDLGYKNIAVTIANEAKEKYANRRAMVEEFLKAGF